MMMRDNIYAAGLERCEANYVPLTPLTFIERSASVYPDRTAVVYGEVRRSWKETYDRCRQLASALRRRGIGPGDTVSVLAANIPEIFECHFGIPMNGAVLNTINIRLDAEAVAFILAHAEAKAFIVDPEFADIAADALAGLPQRPLVIDIVDPMFAGSPTVGELTY